MLQILKEGLPCHIAQVERVGPQGRRPVRFGRIGTAGQSQTKSFANDAKAQHEADKLIAEKLKKGYVEKSGP